MCYFYCVDNTIAWKKIGSKLTFTNFDDCTHSARTRICSYVWDGKVKDFYDGGMVGEAIFVAHLHHFEENKDLQPGMQNKDYSIAVVIENHAANQSDDQSGMIWLTYRTPKADEGYEMHVMPIKHSKLIELRYFHYVWFLCRLNTYVVFGYYLIL